MNEYQKHHAKWKTSKWKVWVHLYVLFLLNGKTVASEIKTIIARIWELERGDSLQRGTKEFFE